MKSLPVWAAAMALLLGSAAQGAPATGTTQNGWSTRDYDLYPGDFNGDGLDDFLYVAKSPDKPSGIALSDGKSPAISQQTWLGNHLGITWYGNYYKPIIGDYNGDGHDDVFMQRQTPGDHYLILTDPAKSRLLSIAQTIPNQYRGQVWSADRHVIHSGDFDGDGRSDLLLQGTTTALKHSIFLADSNGQFAAKAQQTWSDGYLGFGWSVARSAMTIGDFDGDGRDDVFLQGQPDFVPIAYEVPFEVPAWAPGSFAVLLAKAPDGKGAIFQLASIQQVWDERYLGASWSPLLVNVLAGDFNGDGRDDLLLQSKAAGRPSYWLPSNIAAQFTSLVGLAATNVDWSAAQHRLLVANFDGGSVVGLYLQATSPDEENSYANVITGSSVTPVLHSMAMMAAPTAVGATPGEFSVDESGGANYRIPLRLPPGVTGMTPELALVYNSRGGNGPVGMRFGVAGLSSITRCGTTWAVDGFIDGVDFDSNDRYCLDGQRLLAVSGMANYGAVGAEYRTELQSFQKVTSTGGVAGDPQSFSVRTKSGQTLTYGTSADSRVEAQGRTQALAWNLQRITDQYGNFIEFTYEENTAQSAARPIMVRYGGASGSEVGRVIFNYESRIDTSSGYIGGS